MSTATNKYISLPNAGLSPNTTGLVSSAAHDQALTNYRLLPIKPIDIVQVLYDYGPADQKNIIPLFQNELVYVMAKSSSGWWDGVVFKDDRLLIRGWFPKAFTRQTDILKAIKQKLEPPVPVAAVPEAGEPVSLARLKHDRAKTNATIVTLVQAEELVSLKFGNEQIYWLPQVGPENKTLYYNADLDVYCNQLPFSTRSNDMSFLGRTVSSTTQASDDQAQSLGARSLGSNNDNGAGFKKSNKLISFFKSKKDTQKPRLAASPKTNSMPRKYPEEDNNSSHSDHQDSVNSNNANQSSVFSLQNNSSLNLKYSRDNNSSENFGSKARGFGILGLENPNSYSSAKEVSHNITELSELFIQHPKDITTWSGFKEVFFDLLDRCLKAVVENDKHGFTTMFNLTSKVSLLLYLATRLSHEKLLSYGYEVTIKKRLMKVSRCITQIGVNGNLYLSLRELIPETSEPPQTVKQQVPSKVLAGQPNKEYDLKEDVEKNTTRSYLDSIKVEMTVLKTHVDGCYKVFEKIEGTDMKVPMIYPRFITGFFSGGSWENPFFDEVLKKPRGEESLAADIKRRELAIKDFQQRSKRIINLSNENLTVLTIKLKNLFDILDEIILFVNLDCENDNTALEKRNLDIIGGVYKTLAGISVVMNIFESFDFSVFDGQAIIGKSEESLSLHSFKDESLSSRSSVGHQEPTKPVKVTAGQANGVQGIVSIAYPILIEFFEVKQDLHSLIVELIIDSQCLTAEDPSVFEVLRNDNITTFGASLLGDLSKVTIDDLANSLKETLTLTTDIREDVFKQPGIQNFDDNMRELIKKIRDNLNILLILIGQLIEEKESLIEYSERMMNNSLDIERYLTDRKVDLSDKGYLIDDVFILRPEKAKKAPKNENLPWFLDSDEEYFLYYDTKGEIKGGTKEVLVTRLTTHENFDPKFNKVFLSTFRSMMTPAELVELLKERFNISAPEGLSFEEYDLWHSGKAYPIRLRCINVMKMLLQKYWVEAYSGDKKFLELWLQFAKNLIGSKFPSSKILHEEIESKIHDKVIIRRGGAGSATTATVSTAFPPEPVLPVIVKNHRHLRLLDIDYVEFARQLTIRDSMLYSRITLFQCLERVWKHRYGSFGGSADITEFINNSNNLTNYVGHLVLRKHDTVRRSKTIEFFIKVADKCREFKNFSSMTAIISSLSSSPIHRLSKTWALIDEKLKTVLDEMNKLMNPKRNFNEYREMLKYVSSVACVPFVGVFLTDLTFIANGTPDYLNGDPNVINFYKRAKMESIITNVLTYQEMAYPFLRVDTIQEFIKKGYKETPSTDSQYQISLILEPRESASAQLSNINAIRAKLRDAAVDRQETAQDNDKTNELLNNNISNEEMKKLIEYFDADSSEESDDDDDDDDDSEVSTSPPN